VIFILAVMFFIIFSFVYSSLFASHIQRITSLASSSIVKLNKLVSFCTSFFSKIYCCWTSTTQNIFFVSYNSQVVWIDTCFISAYMIQLLRRSISIFWKFSKLPQIKQSMCFISFSSPIGSPIAFGQASCPVPTLSLKVYRYFGEYTSVFSFCKHRPIIPYKLAS